MNFCSRFLRLSVPPLSKKGPQMALCEVKCCGRLKCRVTGLDGSTSWRCSRKRSPSRLPAKGAGGAINNINGGRGEPISDLNGSFRSRYPVTVENERTSFATCVSALKITSLVITF